LKKFPTNPIIRKIRALLPSKGFTLIEIIFSVTLLSIVAMGTAQYMVYSRWDIDRGIRRQLAWINMASRMEEAVDWGFDALPDSLPETNQLITANNLTAYRTTEVFGIDDTTDGLSPTDTDIPDYYMIEIKISWFTTRNVSDSLTDYISAEMAWDY
jgi:prepilin-type N-terminal cleavage/methylation domain-containing protein